MPKRLIRMARSMIAGTSGPRLGVLMVCMGNICRSPTAEAVLRDRLNRKGWADRVLLDSAGTHGYHVGAPPDPRAIEHAARRGYDLSGLRARRVAAGDFERFELILPMDDVNLADLQQRCPPAFADRLWLLLEAAAYPVQPARRDVPDPYYGGPAGFEQVLDLVEGACDALIPHIERRLSALESASGPLATGGPAPSARSG
jgi:protein-tyrosine phosphatase